MSINNNFILGILKDIFTEDDLIEQCGVLESIATISTQNVDH